MAGRGVAYTERLDTIVAVICEVEVDRRSGRIWAKRFTVAQDCGQIINPGSLRLVLEGNMVHAASRTLYEETRFNRNSVESVDWASYPILDMADAPESIDVVMMDKPGEPPSGAGEPSSRAVPAAIANAIFDATGIRLRRAPLTAARMKAALERAARHYRLTILPSRYRNTLPRFSVSTIFARTASDGASLIRSLIRGS